MTNSNEIRALSLEMRALFEKGSPAGLEAILPSFREFQKKVNRELFESEVTVADTEPEKWFGTVLSIMDERAGLKLYDLYFKELFDYTKLVPAEERKSRAIASLHRQPPQVERAIIKFINMFPGIYGHIDPETNDYNTVDQRVEAIGRNIDDLKELYGLLADYRSKAILTETIKNWYDFDYTRVLKTQENLYSDYFDHDIIRPLDGEVFVDAGGYTGDTAIEFDRNFPSYKKIICYEIMPSLCEKIRENTKELHDIDVRNKGLSKKNGAMYVNDKGDSVGQLQEAGETAVEVVRLDDDIKEKVTWIKMDIEGAEFDALEGCRRHIAEEAPVLTICVYHNYDDIARIPKLIQSMRDDYSYYLRSNSTVPVPTEFVLFAVPKDRRLR